VKEHGADDDRGVTPARRISDLELELLEAAESPHWTIGRCRLVLDNDIARVSARLPGWVKVKLEALRLNPWHPWQNYDLRMEIAHLRNPSEPGTLRRIIAVSKLLILLEQAAAGGGGSGSNIL
jgi:hypothetical protein